MPVARRRGNREGSIYQRASDGRWIGAVSAGDGSAGRSGRKTVSAPTRQEALRKLRELQRQLDDGLPPPDASMTVAQLLDRWHADVIRHQVARTASDNYKSVADHHIVPALGRKKLKELTPGDIDRLMAQKLEAGLSVSTVRRIRSVLSQALTQGIRWGSVNRNVASLTRGPRQPRQEGRTLTPSQARTLLASLRGHRNEALYSLMLSTGLRRGEALGLRWDDLDLDEEILIVRRQLKREGGCLIVADTKTTRSRRAVHLPSPMIGVLRAHRAAQARQRLKMGPAWQDTGFVFTTANGTPFDPRNLYRDFQLVCRRAGLGDWHPHELRHSAAS